MNHSKRESFSRTKCKMEFEHKVAALDDEDLVVGEKEEKNWKGIVISLLVIGSIMGAIVIAIVLCTPDGDTDMNRMKLEFEHVVSDAYKVRSFNGAWLSEKEIVYVDQKGSIVIFDAEKNASSSILVKTYDKTQHTMNGFKLSADRKSILYVTDSRSELGTIRSARYAIFNISSQTVEFLDEFIRSEYLLKPPQVQYAAWGPWPSSIVFIESNDIYFVPDFSASQNGQPSRAPSQFKAKFLRLTKNGAMSESITNGLPDSLYRMNIFDPSSNEAALWWSDDGRHLAYLAFDDALVEQTPIEFYDNYMYDSNVNPRIYYERYPRAGSINPRVTVHVVDLINGDSFESSVVVPPAELIKQQQIDPKLSYYVTYVGWLPKRQKQNENDANENQLLIMWSNRAQNSSLLTACDDSGRSNWKCDILTTFLHRIPPSSDAKKAILATHDSNGTRLIFFALPRPDSVIGDHYHVSLLRGDERSPKYLTHGLFDLDRLLNYDPSTDTLYFEVKASESGERHLYKTSRIGHLAQRQTTCLTCNLDEYCGYNKVHLSPKNSGKFIVHECLGPKVPTTRMRQISEDGYTLTSRAILNTDPHLENIIRTRQMPIERYMTIKASQQFPYDVNIKLYLPNESDDEKDKRFPLLIESCEISKRNVWKKFELDWGKYLASKKQLAYAKIDCIKSGPQMPPSSYSVIDSGQGPGSRSTSSFGSMDMRDASIALSGSADTDDTDLPLANARIQTEAIKYLAENTDLFSFIDRRRIAIWGPTSTSAYMALASTLADDSKIIQCTIAVSPITNWRFMNSYAAEHYLGLPWLDSNNLKYERSNLLKRSSEFATRKLLLIHGTADEQVHVQHTMQFIKALTDHHPMGGVIHQMQLYPDIGHSLDPVKKHFYLTLDGFIDRCFYQKPITIKATEWKGKRPKLY